MPDVNESTVRIEHLLFPYRNPVKGSVFACITFDPPGPCPVGSENNVRVRAIYQENTTKRNFINDFTWKFMSTLQTTSWSWPWCTTMASSTCPREQALWQYLQVCGEQFAHTRKSGVTELRQDVEVEQINWQALDHPKHKCLVEGKGNISSCVKTYMDNQVGCSLDGKMNRCRTMQQVKHFAAFYSSH